MGSLLIVEDETEVVQHLRDYFELHGITVYTANNGEDGLALIQSKEPDLVLMDVKMGTGITGIEVLRRAKALKVKSEIIMITAVDDANITQLAMGFGAIKYITKPFQVEDLDKIVLSHFSDK